MDNTLYLKCPYDGTVITVENQPGLQSQRVRCPACNISFPFSRFKVINPGWKDSNGAAETVNMNIGSIEVLETGEKFKLKIGRNTIGRKDEASYADIQLDTAGDLTVSREHLVIEVRRFPRVGISHFAYLFKKNVSSSSIGDKSLKYDDQVPLKDGDTIKLSNLTLKFEIKDEMID